MMGCFVGCLCLRNRDEQRVHWLEVFANTDSREVVDMEHLLEAPENSRNFIKDSTFGTTYKAHFRFGTLVVKRLRDVTVSKERFQEMIGSIRKLNHENLLPLRAYHYGNEGKLLMYDYMPMGSLSDFLTSNRDKKYPLKWNSRFGIALGVARAIAHLHSHTMFHGNIRPSNILLTEFLEARVCDLLDHIARPYPGYSRDVGCCAPEMTDAHTASQEGDVFSFGVVLLRLLTGKTSSEVNLPEWILTVVENELTSEVFELDLLQYENVEEQLVRLLQVAISCTARNPRCRPSMAEVKSQIEQLSHFDAAPHNSSSPPFMRDGSM